MAIPVAMERLEEAKPRGEWGGDFEIFLAAWPLAAKTLISPKLSKLYRRLLRLFVVITPRK